MSTTPSREHHFESRLVWTGARHGGTTNYETYSREYRVDIPGKVSFRGSSAAAFRGDPNLANPEDLLVAALSACHFLSYLAYCARDGVNVVAYEDNASGTMQRVERVTKFTEVVLKPRVTVAPGSDVEKAKALHEKAHHACFIANSVNFPVRNEPEILVAATA
ncbi:MAG TPA: OsmC family protein [Candidatus Eisenbacteria bacterium]|nr:OsmC family protein [Candidatus Eisenbacteria bacterium]